MRDPNKNFYGRKDGQKIKRKVLILFPSGNSANYNKYKGFFATDPRIVE